MALLSSEWQSSIPEEEAAELLEQEKDLKLDLFELAHVAGIRLRDGRVERAEVHGPKAEYKAEGQPEAETTEAWLTNFIRFANAEWVSLHTRKVTQASDDEKVPVEGSERTQFTVRTSSQSIEIDSDQLDASDVRQRVALLQGYIETVQLLEKTAGETVLVPIDPGSLGA